MDQIEAGAERDRGGLLVAELRSSFGFLVSSSKVVLLASVDCQNSWVVMLSASEASRDSGLVTRSFVYASG